MNLPIMVGNGLVSTGRVENDRFVVRGIVVTGKDASFHRISRYKQLPLRAVAANSSNCVWLM
jgi:hypothetical protein